MTVDWEFRKKRWDAYKLGKADAIAGYPYDESRVEERFHLPYKEGYEQFKDEHHN